MAAEKKDSLPGIELFFKKDKYYFQYLNKDGEPIFFSHGYSSESAREKGIEAFIRACREEAHYHPKKTKKKRHFFELKSGNNKKLGRSAQFDSDEDMQEAIDLIRDTPYDVPRFQQREAEDQKKNSEEPVAQEVRKEKEAAPGKQNIQEDAGDDSRSEAGPREKMPRYRFSVTYYPDSQRWTVKHEPSGKALQLDHCNGAEMEAFLTSFVPSEAVEATSSEAASAGLKSAPVQAKPAPLPSSEQLSMSYNWFTHAGEKLRMKGVANRKQVGGIQIFLDKPVPSPGKRAEIQLDIQSITHPSKAVTIPSRAVPPYSTSLYVPLPEVYQLDPGMYRLHLVFQYTGEGEKPRKLESSDLVMLT